MHVLASMKTTLSFIALIFVSVAAHAAPSFSDLSYGDLRERMLVKMNVKMIDSVDRNPEYIVTSARNYAPVLGFKKDLVDVHANQLFRVQYISRSDDFTFTSDSSTSLDGAVNKTGYQIIEITLVPVDGSSLRQNGKSFDVATKAKDGDPIAELTADKDDPVANLQNVRYYNVGLGDELMNVLDVWSPKGTILANSKVKVLAVEKLKRSWSFAHDYRLTVRVSPCTKQLARSMCQTTISSVGDKADPTWGHLQSISNRPSMTSFIATCGTLYGCVRKAIRHKTK